MTRTAIYPGSFDPLTLGHLDIIDRACRLVDRLIVAVGMHHGKKPLFDVEERVKLIENEVAGIAKKHNMAVEVMTFSNLATDFARAQGAQLMIRGLRNSADFNFEMPLAGMNGDMVPEVQTVFLPASPATRHIEGTLVRQVASMGGNASLFVSPAVAEALAAKFRN